MFNKEHWEHREPDRDCTRWTWLTHGTDSEHWERDTNDVRSVSSNAVACSLGLDSVCGYLKSAGNGKIGMVMATGNNISLPEPLLAEIQSAAQAEHATFRKSSTGRRTIGSGVLADGNIQCPQVER